MKILKSSGDPWGTPVIASHHVLTDESIFVLCLRLLSFKLFLVTKYESNLRLYLQIRGHLFLFVTI